MEVSAVYKRILIPTDGSACSERAFDEGLALARALGAEVTFLYVVENPLSVYNMEGSLVYQPELEASLKETGEAALARARRRAEDMGVRAQTRLQETRQSSPVEAILAAEGDFDLTVMGTHGRRGFDRLVLGSVTEKLLLRSAKPRLTIRCPPTPS